MGTGLEQGLNGPATPADWAQLLTDLHELDRGGALGGIRAIVTERLARVRSGVTMEYPAQMAVQVIHYIPVSSAPGSPRHRQLLAEAGAFLAMAADRIPE